MCDSLYYSGVAIAATLWKYPESTNAAWEYPMLLGKYIKSNYSALPSMKALLLTA